LGAILEVDLESICIRYGDAEVCRCLIKGHSRLRELSVKRPDGCFKKIKFQ